MNLGITNSYALLVGRLRREPGQPYPTYLWTVREKATVKLTYEQYQRRLNLSGDTWVRECVTEGCVDDHEEHAAADGTKRRLLSLSQSLMYLRTIWNTHSNRLPLFRESGWASQSDSDSERQNGKRITWMRATVDSRASPPPHSSPGEFISFVLQLPLASIMRVIYFQLHSNPILNHAKCSLLAVRETCPIASPKFILNLQSNGCV